jgi:glycosyltransferase involved in cell wall biosynthesis
VIVKLHPRQTEEEVAREVGSSGRVAFVRDIDKGPLFAAADLFLSTFSSVILWAIALDLPVVTFNCLRIPGGDIFEEIGGTVHARTAADLADAVRRAIADDETAKRLAGERARVRETHMVFDGRVTTRIEALCRELERR